VKVARALAETTERLTHTGCETPRVDAEILLAHVLGVTRSQLGLESARKLSGREEKELRRLVSRREAREPLAYVLGEWGFRRLTLAVDRRVLVPRPETEVVAERCLARLSGSGALALALADEHPGALVTGIDASPEALEVASANALRAELAITLREWDFFHGLPEGPWDLVVSNPPYVLAEEIDTLEPEVREWEPREALVGVGATEAVARGALGVLEQGGALVLEVAGADAARVAALLGDLGYVDVTTTRDLAGRDRVVEGALAA